MALSNRSKIRLIAFDLDGTLINNTVFIWSTLHEYFQTDPVRRQKASEDFFSGKIPYHKWFWTDLELLIERGATRKRILAAFGTLSPAPGASECLAVLKARGYKLAVISGSLGLVLEHFFPVGLFDHVLINQIAFDPSGRISGGDPTPYDLDGKALGLLELARRENLEILECAYVGDNTNDISVMKAAGFSVGVFIKVPEVARVVDVVMEGCDLRLLLPFFPGLPLES